MNQLWNLWIYIISWGRLEQCRVTLPSRIEADAQLLVEGWELLLWPFIYATVGPKCEISSTFYFIFSFFNKSFDYIEAWWTWLGHRYQWLALPADPVRLCQTAGERAPGGTLLHGCWHPEATPWSSSSCLAQPLTKLWRSHTLVWSGGNPLARGIGCADLFGERTRKNIVLDKIRQAYPKLSFKSKVSFADELSWPELALNCWNDFRAKLLYALVKEPLLSAKCRGGDADAKACAGFPNVNGFPVSVVSAPIAPSSPTQSCFNTVPVCSSHILLSWPTTRIIQKTRILTLEWPWQWLLKVHVSGSKAVTVPCNLHKPNMYCLILFAPCCPNVCSIVLHDPCSPNCQQSMGST